jgi:hypothetical protein
MLKLATAWSWRPRSWSWYRPRATRAPAADLEAVRRAMQALMQELGATGSPRLARSLRLARDMHGLWHLRVALMQAIAAECGEGHARRRIRAIDSLFLESWPDAPVSRPAALG